MKIKNVLMTAIAIFGLATITNAQVPSYVPTNGLVGWWPFNGNANDESGNGNNGTNNGASLTADRFNNINSAFSFNGTSNYINIPNNNTLNPGSITISAWINSNADATNIQSGVKAIVTKWYQQINCNNLGDNYNVQLSFLNNQSVLVGSTIANNQVSNYITSQTNLIGLSTWRHIVFIHDINNGQQLFIDGIQINSNTINGSLCTTLNDLLFGADNFNGSIWRFFNGKLDDIGIWNRALTQQEITDMYNGCQLSVTTQPINQTINISNNAQLVVSSSDPNATYQWQTDLGVGFQNLNSVGQYSGTTNDTLTVSNVTLSNNNQPFRCIVTSGSCTDTSNIAVLTVNNNVGINEPIHDKLFSVFPNPAQSFISVKVDSKLIGSVYSIYDNTGRVVLSGKLNSLNTTIEVSNLSGGIYMFSVGENMKQTFKVIKE